MEIRNRYCMDPDRNTRHAQSRENPAATPAPAELSKTELDAQFLGYFCTPILADEYGDEPPELMESDDESDADDAEPKKAAEAKPVETKAAEEKAPPPAASDEVEVS